MSTIATMNELFSFPATETTTSRWADECDAPQAENRKARANRRQQSVREPSSRDSSVASLREMPKRRRRSGGKPSPYVARSPAVAVDKHDVRESSPTDVLAALPLSRSAASELALIFEGLC